MPLPSLSIVIPVFKQPKRIARTIDDAVIAVKRSGFERAEIVVVVADVQTREVLAGLTPPLPLRVLEEELPGRFAARQQGIAAATGELVLLLDSRISIMPDALRFVSDRIADEHDLPIWSAHFEFNVQTPYGRFWSVIIPLVWWRYYSKPRTTSFGLETYDRYPKSTTCFLAPRALLLDAKGQFSSYYVDTRHASDDTGLIRLLAARQPVNVSPDFACLYTPHETYRAFMYNVFNRGRVFIDSYGRPGTRFFPLLLAYFPLSLLAAVSALRRPRLVLGAALAAPMPFVAAALALRRERATVAAAGWVGPNWLAGMSIGLWYGLWLALRARFGRHQSRGARATPNAVNKPY
ncbi:MAG TPA: glycosyltransferase family A protein [Solirubrobacteraceae bacterium]|jgi:glycosyltransferase involved in cell wall biosynthesis|nr:glycosyltransferase family A protein [Solirubrobacteraceae bacterium]